MNCIQCEINKIETHKKSVVVYGNCHTEIITKMLESCQKFNENYYIIPTKRIQNIKDPKELYEDCYCRCDVFIHQSIRLNNRYGEEYASEKIIARLKQGCKIISIPNVYHLPLCFFPQYSVAPELRKDGVTYFFRDSIIDSHLNKPFKLLTLAKTDYDNPNLFDSGDIVASFEAFIDKVRKREKDWDIKVSDYILDNFRSHQLFYDPNHPTNYFLSYIASELLKILLNNDREYANQLKIDKCLDTIEMPICKSVVQALQLDWKNDVIRKTKPYTNRLQCKMNLNNYVYQYISCMWIAEDCPKSLKKWSRLFWNLNTLMIYFQRGFKHITDGFSSRISKGLCWGVSCCFYNVLCQSLANYRNWTFVI